MELNGEVAIVTGGTRNIGRAVAHAYRRAGASVCVVGRQDREALETTLAELGESPPSMARLVDVRDESAVLELFDDVEASLGTPSIIVNGAAERDHVPFMEMSREAWSAVLDTILTGAFLMCRELFRRLPADRKGAIVNLGGLTAHRPAADRAHVIAAKNGLVGLTRALAVEGRGRIRVNAVVPGAIDTERRPGQSSPSEDGEARGSCEDVARVVLSVSRPADVYVTGQSIHVNGGRFMP